MKSRRLEPLYIGNVLPFITQLYQWVNISGEYSFYQTSRIHLESRYLTQVSQGSNDLPIAHYGMSSALPNILVSWVRRRDLHILTIGTFTYTTDQRFKSIHMNNTDDWTLQLQGSRSSDTGVYECQVSTEPKMSLAVQLNIIIPVAYITEGPILYVNIGSSVNLTCYVMDEVGTIFLFWYYNGMVLTKEDMHNRGMDSFTELGTTSTSRLFIAKAKDSDAGNYSCKPSYAAPTNITLQVLSGDEPAAMQPGGQNNEGANAAFILLSALLSFAFMM
ncbi:uncharacterized protein NPIL_674701 [Nephila pilipes]|uniref:Ig-like domain-containing protein n=1 Tax=Nephila pilipes TaxID=299642 RepID=A0A8X6NXH0_NEPPI|nr:uncharacterized protein NPIL_674701 [Nephila pilipes]